MNKNENSLSRTKKIVICAMCIALSVVLPFAFHSIPKSGAIFSPIHIPVLLCGLICGWPLGILCGLLGPLFSSLITGMPTMGMLPPMMIECAIYGFVAGIMLKIIRTKNTYIDLYICLIIAMISGRIGGGIIKLIMTIGTDSTYTIKMFFGAYFITAWPGILIQLVVIPNLIFALMQVKLIPLRYPKFDKHVLEDVEKSV